MLQHLSGRRLMRQQPPASLRRQLPRTGKYLSIPPASVKGSANLLLFGVKIESERLEEAFCILLALRFLFPPH